MPASTIDHAFTARSMTGSAGDPTYAGALSFMRRRYTKNVKGADAIVWGIPFDAAVTNRPGARFGPQAIRRAAAIFDNDPQYPFHRDLFADLVVVDYGDCLLDTGNHQKTPGKIERDAAKRKSCINVVERPCLSIISFAASLVSLNRAISEAFKFTCSCTSFSLS